MAIDAAGERNETTVLFLGPTEVLVGGESTPVTDLQARLLAQLAIAAPAPLRSDQLVEALWPDQRPPNAKASLYNQISRLRTKLGVDLFESAGGAYRLAQQSDIDVATDNLYEIETLIDRGEFAQAERLADDSVALFRGVTLHELAHNDPRAGVVRRRTAEILRSILTLRVRAAIGAGHLGRAVPEAERLVGETPTDERRWALYIDALSASGRRGDALAAFDQARRTLADTLGLQPSAVLTDAQSRVLHSDTVDIERPSKLVGREEFIADVLANMAEHPVTLLYGEHGIGKSRLLVVIENRLARSGVAVAAASGTRHPTHAAQVLNDLAQGLGVSLDPALAPTAAFLGAVSSALARSGRVVFLIDDAGLIGPTAALALSAATRLDGVSFVVANRTQLDTYSRIAMRRVAVPGLAEHQLPALIEERSGRPPSTQTTRWVWEMSGGNPGLVEILAGEPIVHGDEGAGESAGGESAGAVRSLDAVIRRQTERLSSDALDALEVAAVFGSPVLRRVLERVAPPIGVKEVIDRGLLEESGEHVVRFRHGAVRVTTYNSMAPGKRADYHSFILRMGRRHGGTPSQMAPHAYATRGIDPVGSIITLTESAQAASAEVVTDEAVTWLNQAIEIATSLGDAGTALGVTAQIALADLLRRRGDHHQRDVARSAVRAAFDHGDVELIVEAVYTLARISAATEYGTADPETTTAIITALDLVQTDEQLAIVLAAAAEMPADDQFTRAGRVAALEALALQSGPKARLRTIRSAGIFLASPRDLATRLSLEDEIRDLAQSNPRAPHLYQLFAFTNRLMSCQGVEARALHNELRSSFAVLDLDSAFSVTLWGALLAFLEDDLEGAETLVGDAASLIAGIRPSLAAGLSTGALSAIRIAQGREHEMTETIESYVKVQPYVAVWTALLARCVLSEDPERARQLAHNAARDNDNDDQHPFTAIVASLLAAVALEVRDGELARSAIGQLSPFSGQLICYMGSTGGLVDTALARAALARREYRDAARYLVGARQQVRELQAPVFARELDDIAERITSELLLDGIDDE